MAHFFKLCDNTISNTWYSFSKEGIHELFKDIKFVLDREVDKVSI